MVDLKKIAGPDGSMNWVDSHGVIRGRVRSGKPREDTKEHQEREQVEALLSRLGWNRSSLSRPSGSNYEFNCLNPETGELIAVEVKRVLPERAMRDAATGDKTEIDLGELRDLPVRLLGKANDQLAAAPEGVRRYALLLSPWEDTLFWPFLVEAIRNLSVDSWDNLDEVWLTSSHLRLWAQVPNAP